MGWFGGSPVKLSPVTEAKQEPQQFLEDLPPKFEDAPAPEPPKAADVLSQIKLSDFTVERYVGMPCFREAMLTGFQAMAVLGGVTFVIHKNPSRSLNWGVLGFFLGNVIGWEQCRSLRRRSFETMEKARQANADKNARKWTQNHENDDRMDKWKAVQEGKGS